MYTDELTFFPQQFLGVNSGVGFTHSRMSCLQLVQASDSGYQLEAAVRRLLFRQKVNFRVFNLLDSPDSKRVWPFSGTDKLQSFGTGKERIGTMPEHVREEVRCLQPSKSGVRTLYVPRAKNFHFLDYVLDDGETVIFCAVSVTSPSENHKCRQIQKLFTEGLCLCLIRSRSTFVVLHIVTFLLCLLVFTRRCTAASGLSLGSA